MKYMELRECPAFLRSLRDIIGGRNTKYKSKNGINVSIYRNKTTFCFYILLWEVLLQQHFLVSFITDINGTPISVGINSGNKHDSIIADKLFDNITFVDSETIKVKNNNKYKQILLGDAAYFNNNLHNKLRNKGYTPITDVNYRNTKNLIKRRRLFKLKKQYNKVKYKRIKIENCNAWVKKYPKMSRLIEKTIKSFSGLLLIALSLIAINKIK